MPSMTLRIKIMTKVHGVRSGSGCGCGCGFGRALDGRGARDEIQKDVPKKESNLELNFTHPVPKRQPTG
jgi:hypothetical protein